MSFISEIQSATNVKGAESAGVERSNLGRDDFLKIFLTQLNQQDPLNPMEGTEFTAQLAQFSSLEQLFNLNENVASLKEQQSDGTRFQALSLLGMEVLAEGDTLQLSEDSVATGAFHLPEQADCTVLVKDRYGNIVRRIRLGPLGQGSQVFQWDGLDDGGNRAAPGTYSFEVEALGEEGQGVLADPMIRGKVTRVNLEGAEPVLYAGETPISLSSVQDVREPETQGTEGLGGLAEEESDLSV